MRIIKLTQLNNGDIVPVGNEYYVFEHQSSSGSTYRSYTYDDVIVVKVDKEGYVDVDE